MAKRYWPFGTPAVTPIPPAMDFVRIVGSHIDECRMHGRQVHAVRINDADAGRCGITDVVEVLGRPIFRDNSLPLGTVRLKLDDGTLYELLLPVYFTEDR